jgi:hypothetical protein
MSAGEKVKPLRGIGPRSSLVPFDPRTRGDEPSIWRVSAWHGYLQGWNDEERSRSMTSEELRRIVLKQFYDQRTTEYFTPMHALVCEEAEGNLADICDQLAKGGPGIGVRAIRKTGPEESRDVVSMSSKRSPAPGAARPTISESSSLPLITRKPRSRRKTSENSSGEPREQWAGHSRTRNVAERRFGTLRPILMQDCATGSSDDQV